MSAVPTEAAPATLVFDLQGTCLDFFTPVNAAVTSFFASRGVSADGPSLTRHWRRTYMEAAERIAGGTQPFAPTARIYRDGLDEVLDAADLGGHVDGGARDALSGAWTTQVPWPDTAEALRRLRRRFGLVVLTNGGLGTSVDIAARHDLGFHAILTGEMVRSCKPAEAMYRFAIDTLARPAASLVMVASHPYDLRAARSHGMRTAFVSRPHELGPDGGNDAAAPPGTDWTATDLLDLAGRLGA